MCRGTETEYRGTHPSSDFSPTRNVASKQLLQRWADFQEQGVCHFLFIIGLLNNKVLMGKDLEDLRGPNLPLRTGCSSCDSLISSDRKVLFHGTPFFS